MVGNPKEFQGLTGSDSKSCNHDREIPSQAMLVLNHRCQESILMRLENDSLSRLKHMQWRLIHNGWNRAIRLNHLPKNAIEEIIIDAICGTQVEILRHLCCGALDRI